jgi:hypothetical protein
VRGDETFDVFLSYNRSDEGAAAELNIGSAIKASAPSLTEATFVKVNRGYRSSKRQSADPMLSPFF